VLN
jgi:hypothetical protein